MIQRILLSTALLLGLAAASVAQQAGIALSPTSVDSSQPVEVTSDNLEVTQDSSTALFTGNAKVSQGELRLAADKVLVKYNAEQSAIEFVEATSNVVFTNGAEVAEAQKAIYRVASGTVLMTGSVLLLQGNNAISGDNLNLDLTSNRGVMKGNVKTVFVPKTDQ